MATKIQLTGEQAGLAKAWATAFDAMVAAKDDKDARAEERKARSALWLGVGRDQATFDAVLEAVGKPRSRVTQAAPVVPMPKLGREPRAPYVPKRDWEPEAGQKIRIKLYEPDDFEGGVLVGEDKYGYIAFIEGRGRRRVTKSRIYPIRNLDGSIQTVNLATLPAEATTAQAWEKVEA